MIMYQDIICDFCGKKFSWKIEKLPTKLEDKRWEDICCPYCQKTNAKKLILGNEEIKSIP